MPDMKVVEIPANATEDRVAGSIDIEAALKRRGKAVGCRTFVGGRRQCLVCG